MKAMLMPGRIALVTMGTMAVAGCGSSTEPGNGGGSGACNVSLSGAKTASLQCSAATVAWSSADNVTVVGILPSGSTPLVTISFGLPGQPGQASYHNTDLGAVIALAVTDGTNTWIAAVGGGATATGSATLTLTSISTTVSTADGKIYAAHGTITATLQPDPSTPATGTVTLNAAF